MYESTVMNHTKPMVIRSQVQQPQEGNYIDFIVSALLQDLVDRRELLGLIKYDFLLPAGLYRSGPDAHGPFSYRTIVIHEATYLFTQHI